MFSTFYTHFPQHDWLFHLGGGDVIGVSQISCNLTFPFRGIRNRLHLREQVASSWGPDPVVFSY